MLYKYGGKSFIFLWFISYICLGFIIIYIYCIHTVPFCCIHTYLCAYAPSINSVCVMCQVALKDKYCYNKVK